MKVRWLLLFTMSGIWGASYFFIAIALRSFAPLMIVASRMGIAAVALAVAAIVTKTHLPRSSGCIGGSPC